MASDDAVFGRARLLGRVSLAACVLMGLVAMALAVGSWDAIPERVPTHFGGSGAPDAWGHKNWATVFVLPLMALLMGPGLAWLAIVSVGRDHLPGAERQSLRRALPSLANFLSGLAFLSTLLLSGMAIGATRVATGQAQSLGWGALAGAIGLVVWAIGGSIWMLIKHSPLSAKGREAVDPSSWKWGALYVNPNDPSLFVEKRWGGGYTINFGIPAGRRLGLAFLGFFVLMLLLGLAAIVSSTHRA